MLLPTKLYKKKETKKETKKERRKRDMTWVAEAEEIEKEKKGEQRESEIAESELRDLICCPRTMGFLGK